MIENYKIEVCQYCYSNNQLVEGLENAKCYHCNAPLNIERPMFNYEKREIELNEIFLNYDELSKYNIFDLYRLLQLARKEKNTLYKNQEFNEEYILIRKQCKLIENLIFDIIGSKPGIISSSHITLMLNDRNKFLNEHFRIIEKNIEKSIGL